MKDPGWQCELAVVTEQCLSMAVEPAFERTQSFPAEAKESPGVSGSESRVVLRSLRPFIVVCQIGGLYPMEIRANETPVFRYRALSWRGFYAVLCTVSVCVYGFPSVGTFVSKVLTEPDTWVSAATACVIQMHLTGTYLLMVLGVGKELTGLLVRWLQSEDEMRQNGVILHKKIIYKCWIFTAITFSLIVTEDSLFVAQSFANSSADSAVAHFQSTSHTYPRHWVVGGFRMINEVFIVVGWAFIDCCVLLLSIGFQENFIALNLRLAQWKTLSLREKEDFRLCYHNVIILARDADRILGSIILLGSLCNIADLILLIYSGFFKDIFSEDILKKATAVFVSTYLLGRTTAACYYSGSMSEQAREGLRLIGQLRIEAAEDTSKIETFLINRFTHQLTLPLGFTGNGFFTLNLAYLIVVGSTVLTYEILLLQMNSNRPNSCLILNTTTTNLTG